MRLHGVPRSGERVNFFESEGNVRSLLITMHCVGNIGCFESLARMFFFCINFDPFV